jgi:FixJ family two-component response regulator
VSTERLESRGRERVYLVDDDAAVLRSVSRLLRSAGLDPVGYGSADAFLRELAPDAVGCVVLDLSMPGLDGLALQRELSARGSALPVVFMSGHADVPKSVSAMKEGAVDFLTKPVRGQVLLQAVEKALSRNRASREDRRAVDELHRRVASLTQREREVMEGVAAGRLNKQIAGELGIAEQTVKVHRARVMEKMAAASVADLVRMVDRAGLRQP